MLKRVPLQEKNVFAHTSGMILAFILYISKLLGQFTTFEG